MIYGNKVSLVIPVYNEPESIKDVISGAKSVEEVDEIIVVDDGSTDNTGEVLSSIEGIQVISHPYNLGNGASVKSGIRAASGDVVVMMDADGQHSPLDLPEILLYLNDYDMVIGSRYGVKNSSKFRGFGNRILIVIANFLSNSDIKDLTSGFRAIKRTKILEFLHLLPNKFSYPTTSILAFLHSGYTIKYVTMKNFKKRIKGKSSIKPFRDGVRFIQIILRMVMLFNPQKIFIPVSLLFLFSGTGMVIWNIYLTKGIQESSVLLLILGVFLFFFGLLAEQISSLRREIRKI